MEPQPIISQENIPKKSFWHKPRNFVYAALLITLVAGGLTLYIKYHERKIFEQEDTAVTSVQSSPWEGQWIRENSRTFEESKLVISDVTPVTFKFQVSSFSGGNMGVWANYNTELADGSGTLALQGSIASYVDGQPEEGAYFTKPCTATFSLSPDNSTLTLETNCDFGDINESIGGYAGLGVTFGGTYRKDVVVKQVNIRDAQLFADSPKSYTAFAALVGSDEDDFDSTMDLENGPENDPELDAKYSSFAVRHLYSISESMIMVSGTKVWAAVYGYDGVNREDLTKYYTNVAGWEKKVPESIKEWNRERKIIYMSAK